MRQYVIDAMPSPAKTVASEGNEPRAAFPASTLLQFTYCVIIFAKNVTANVIPGNSSHKTNVNEGIESLN